MNNQNNKCSYFNKNINKYMGILITIFIMIQIHLCVEAAPRTLRWSKEFVTYISFGYISIVFLYFVIFKRIKINIKSFYFLMIILCGNLFAILVNQDFQYDNYIFLSIVISGFYICNIFSINDYFEGYVKAIIFYSIFSLIATYFLLPLIMQGYLSFFPTSINFLGTPFVDMGLSFAVKWHGLMRNQGIFREPGVYQFFILVALSIELLYLRRPWRKFNVLILISTLVSTFSTAGLIALIPIIYAFIINGRIKNRIKNIVVVSTLLIVVFTIAVSNNEIYFALKNSLSKLGAGLESGSFITRYESVINLLKMSLHNPLFGNSFVNGLIYLQDHYNTFGTRDVTGTMFAFIMALGYPIGIWCVYNFYKFCARINGNLVISILIFISLFISLNTQMLIYNTVVWTFLFMPYMKNDYVVYKKG